jgi:hypothetical protein
MDGKRALQRLFRWPRRRPEPGAIDAADVGTAYGMELSLDETRGNAAAAPTPDTRHPPARSAHTDRRKRR